MQMKLFGPSISSNIEEVFLGVPSLVDKYSNFFRLLQFAWIAVALIRKGHFNGCIINFTPFLIGSWYLFFLNQMPSFEFPTLQTTIRSYFQNNAKQVKTPQSSFKLVNCVTRRWESPTCCVERSKFNYLHKKRCGWIFREHGISKYLSHELKDPDLILLLLKIFSFFKSVIFEKRHLNH